MSFVMLVDPDLIKIYQALRIKFVNRYIDGLHFASRAVREEEVI